MNKYDLVDPKTIYVYLQVIVQTEIFTAYKMHRVISRLLNLQD